MGEKRTRLEKIRAKFPICCYCRQNPTESVDHCPPKILFSEKQRPEGFEFPACNICNGKSSIDDAVSALIFSMTPNGQFDHEKLKLDAIKRFKSVNILAPEILREMFQKRFRRNFEKRELKSMGFDPHRVNLSNIGEKTRKHLYNFAAKLTVAAYFENTKRLCAETTEVSTVVMLNWQIQKFGLPTLPFPYDTILSLSQGRKDTSEQFALAQIINLEEKIGAFAFQFHENAIVFGFLCENGFSDDLGDPEALRKIGNLFI